MSIFKRRPSRLERVLSDFDREIEETRSKEAAKPFAARCRHVRTASARKAHLLPPGGSAVLCGWPGATYDADESLAVCHMCEDEARKRDRLEAAS